MGLFRTIGRFLRTGFWTRSLAKYSRYETLTPAYSMVDESKYISEGYRNNSLVYRCVTLLANSASQPVMMGVRETPEGDTELPPADPLTALLDRPSTEHGSQTGFIAEIVVYLMLLGEAPLYKVPGDTTGRTVELQLLKPSRVEVKRETKGKVYLYRFDPAQPAKKLENDQLIFLRLRDPSNKDRGLPPLAAAARETDTDNETTNYRKAFFNNAAIPPGILTTEQPASPEQLEGWAAKWAERTGGENRGRTPALAGGLTYQKIGATPGELAFPELTGLSESRICMAFGVPPMLVGAKVGLDRSTYNNYQNARTTFWEDTVAPLVTLLEDELTAGLTVQGDGRKVIFDTSDVPALQEDADKKAERAGKALSRGAATVNDYRDALDLEPVPDGDVYFIPKGAQVVRAGDLGTVTDAQAQDGETADVADDEALV